VNDAFDDLNACIEDVGYRNAEAVLLGCCEML
jgi:aspartate/glutamate racemase